MRKTDLEKKISSAASAAYADLVERTKTDRMPAVVVDALRDITRHPIEEKKS